MAPKKKAVVIDEIEPVEPVAEEVIEEIVPEPVAKDTRHVTFVLSPAQRGTPPRGDDEDGDDEDGDDEDGDDADGDDEDGDDEDGDADGDEGDSMGDDGDDDMGIHDDELITAVGQLTQLMMTDDGEAITDVLAGVRDHLEKQTKILYRGLQLLEARFGRR